MAEKKTILNEEKLYSIITVCYNAETCIEETLKSIINQSYTNFEYIIIDGKSTDNTMMIVDSYRNAFREKGIPFIVVSEKDNGIYDAMNKGIDICIGKWVNFMNAGDCFHDIDILKNLLSYCEDDKYDLVFGDTVLKEKEYYKYSQSSDFKREMSFCHQSAFTSSKCLKDLHFDTNYIISADNHFYVRASKSDFNFCRVQFPIAIFSTDGLSSKNYSALRKEYALIRLQEGIWNKEQYNKEIKDIDSEEKAKTDAKKEQYNNESDFKSFLKRIIPKPILNCRYKHIAKKRRKKAGWTKKCP